MIDYIGKADFIACYSHNLEKYDDVYLGAIIKDYDGCWVFYPDNNVSLNCEQLKLLSIKLLKMNMEL